MSSDDARPSTPSPATEEGRRRPYQTPRLVRLGTLTEITLATMSSNQMSDSGGPHLKT